MRRYEVRNLPIKPTNSFSISIWAVFPGQVYQPDDFSNGLMVIPDLPVVGKTLVDKGVLKKESFKLSIIRSFPIPFHRANYFPGGFIPVFAIS